MSNNTPSVANPANRTPVMNFLSSLNADLGGSTDLASLFETMLDAAKAAESSADKNTSAAKKPAELTVTTTLITNAPQKACAAIKDIMDGLRTFATKWNSYHDKNQGSQSQPSKTTSANDGTGTCATTKTASSSSTDSNASTATDTNDTTTPTSATNTIDAAADTATTATDDTTVDLDTPPVLSDLLAELQAILQMLQQQIKTSQTSDTKDQITVITASGSTATSATTDIDTPATQELLAAGGALADLLALLQLLEKKLDMASPDDAAPTAAGTTTTTATTPTVDAKLAELDAQIRTSLKTLLDNLKTAVASAPAAKTDTAKPVTEITEATQTPTKLADALTTNLTTGLAVAPTTDTTSATTPQATATTATTTDTSAESATPAATTPSQIIKDALATANDFMKQLNNLYGNAPAATPAAPAALTADAATVKALPLEMDIDGNAPTTPSTNAATTPTPITEGVKSANPYSFASQLSATRSSNTTGQTSPVEQVLLFLNRNVKSGNDQMTLQLHPAELGTINIKLDIASNGNVSGTVTANNADTLAMLQKDSRSLERALQEAGLRADPGSLQFNLGGQSNQQSNQMAQQNRFSNGNSSSTPSADDLAALANETVNDTTASWVIAPGRVNIKV